MSNRIMLILFAIFGLNTSVWAQFSLEQIPALENKAPLTLVAEKGFWTDYLNDKMLPEFTARTGVAVKVVSTPLDTMFALQTDALKAGNGQYDVLSMEAGWAKEWAASGFTVPLLELAKLYDPAGEIAMQNYLEPYYPSLLDILSYHGEIHGIPYNNYVMANHFREDLFTHPIEQAQFAKQFGYPLAPPSSFKALKDTAQFFTRKTGELLAGTPLAQPFYGVALMSGNRPHINDEFSSILWSLQGAWMRPIKDETGQINHFNIDMVNRKAIEAANIYQGLMPFAIPANDQFAFNEAANALATGRVAMWPFAYNNLWAESFKVEHNIPGARLGVAQVPGGHPYNGAYAFAVSYDSKNPQAAYWLLKYLGTFEAQRAYALGGGNPCRMDVVQAPEFQTEKMRAIAGAFNASHQANVAWQDKTQTLGHFASSAMGQIYPELTQACYDVTVQPQNTQDRLMILSQKILLLQNTYGEYPAMATEQ